MNELVLHGNAWYLCRIDRRLYRETQDGAEVMSLLRQIYNASLTAKDPFWALRLRKQIRRLEELNVRPVLVHVIENAPNDRMRTLAIWLRGRCGGYVGTTIIAESAHSSSFAMRKECVRALQRLSGWAYLREIAGTTENPRIRRLATQYPSSALDGRLAAVRAITRRRSASTNPPQLWLLPGLRVEETAPKTSHTIRLILHRIKRLIANSSA